jgi:hypothetical protein
MYAMVVWLQHARAGVGYLLFSALVSRNQNFPYFFWTHLSGPETALMIYRPRKSIGEVKNYLQVPNSEALKTNTYNTDQPFLRTKHVHSVYFFFILFLCSFLVYFCTGIISLNKEERSLFIRIYAAVFTTLNLYAEVELWDTV